MIKKMDVDIAIHKDSSYTVAEDIRVDFLGEEKHGIFRDITVKGQDRYGSGRSLRVKILSVTNGYGQAWQHADFPTGQYYRVKIGSPDTLISGKQRFVITYRVENGLLFFPDHDELWWNATGNEWPTSIESASCTVHAPSGVPGANRQVGGWIGATGSQEPSKYRKTADGAKYWTPRPLGYAEGLTVATGWPKGFVSPPSGMQRLLWFVGDNLFALLPFLFLAGLIYTWYSYGRDPDVGISEAVRYEPPDKLRPAEIGTLMDESADLTDITSTIVDMAVRGYLKINEIPASGFLGRKSYQLIKATERSKEDPQGGLAGYEQEIFDKIFSLGDTVDTSDLKNHFYSSISSIKSKLYTSLVDRRYFRTRPDTVRSSWSAAGFVLLIGGIVLAVVMLGSMDTGSAILAPGWGVSLAICGILTLLFAKAMPRKTALGRKALLDAKGFEEYLRRAEIENITLDERKNIFEAFLPYAICLGVADKWSRAFEGIYTEPPGWYGGAWDGGFHPYYFSHSLNGAMRDMGSAMVSAPRSASQGGSAFGGGGSGGGFSGGGSGGGGGGSW